MARSLLSTVTISLLLTLVLLGFVPQAQAYTFLTHSICKGWTEAGEPISAERFLVGDSVYLYFHISWESSEEASKADFTVTLIDPERSETNIGLTTFYKVKFESGCLTSAFLRILNVTETTKNGIWRVNWYDGGKLVFSEEFTVGFATPSPSPTVTPSPSPPTPAPAEKTFAEQYGLWIIAVVGVVIVAVAIIMVSKRKRKPPYAPTPTPTVTLELKYCTECGSQIPVSDGFCNRCGAKQ